MIKKLLSLLLVLGSLASFAQSQPGSLKGTVKDKRTGETIPFANITIKQSGVLVTGGTTDFDGNYNINPVNPGVYSVECTFIGYAPFTVNGVNIPAGRPKVLDFQMQEESELLPEIVVTAQEELIEKGKTSDVITAAEIKNSPFRGIGQLAAMTPGVQQADEGQAVNIRGARGSTTVYYIDGVPVRGNIELPREAILQTEVITGGLPAQYGDATGGVISTTTRGASPVYFGSAEVLSSSLFDQYHYNLGALTVGGPLYRNKQGKPIVGFLFAGEFQYDKDAAPRALDNYKVKDDVLRSLEQNPLTPSNVGLGVINSAEFLRLSDLTTQSYRENAAQNQIRLNANIKVETSANTSLMFGGRYNAFDGTNYSRASSLMNYNTNTESNRKDWTVLARFTQRFGGGNDSVKSLISNAFYSIQMDYTRNQGTTWDPRFKDDVFSYGHIGKFETTQRRFYVPGTDTILNLSGWTQSVWQDVGVDYTPGNSNPTLANYTSNYYDFIDQNLIFNQANSLENIRAGGGLLNGDSPKSVYSGLWTNVGANQGGYSKYQNSQFRVTATTTFDISDHSLIVGLIYEQRVDRGYGVGAQGLWTQMRLLQNDAIRELDLSNPIAVYDDYGVFQDTINYDRCLLYTSPSPRD